MEDGICAVASHTGSRSVAGSWPGLGCATEPPPRMQHQHVAQQAPADGSAKLIEVLADLRQANLPHLSAVSEIHGLLHCLQ